MQKLLRPLRGAALFALLCFAPLPSPTVAKKGFQEWKGGDGMGFTEDRYKPVQDGFKTLPKWARSKMGHQTKAQRRNRGRMGKSDGHGSHHRRQGNLRHKKSNKRRVKFKRG